MENDKILYRLIEGFPKTKILHQLQLVYQSVFNDADLTFFKQRLQEKEDLLSVCAFYENELIGFKIGYRYNNNTFYSWLGGVKELHRKQGIAKQLAKLQEECVKNNGYTILRTKSMNNFKPMMILNLKNGFDIKQIYTNEKEQTKVVFEKKLN